VAYSDRVISQGGRDPLFIVRRRLDFAGRYGANVNEQEIFSRDGNVCSHTPPYRRPLNLNAPALLW